MLSDDFAELGIDLHRMALPELRLLGDSDAWIREPTGPALVWHHGEERPDRVLLLIHYDTVYPRGSEPSKCQIVNDRLIGPGVADAKGGIAVIAIAIEAMLKFDLLGEMGVSVVLNPDEEIGSTASAELLRSLCPQFKAAFVFEPSLPDGGMVANRKGSGNFSVVVHGKSAHAGRNPDQGRNAIVHLAKVIERLDKLNAVADGITINVGEIDGGGPLNQVPDHAVAKLNARVIDRQAQLHVESSLAQIGKEFSVDGYVVSTLGQFHCPPKRVDEGIRRLQKVVQRAAANSIKQDLHWLDTGGACDGSKLAAWGLPNIDTMGVCGGNLHGPHEFMQIDSLTQSAIKTMHSILGVFTPVD